MARTGPEYCPRCSLWHAAPRCAYDPDRACVQCAGPVYFRWLGDDGRPTDGGDRCWRCFAGVPLAAPYSGKRERDEWLDGAEAG
jgi:hypothetical protein